MSIRKLPAYLEEAVKPYDSRTAMEEASRCLLCHDAPCSKACPAGTDPASFVMSIRFRNVKGAAETIRTANPLGGVCGRVCPAAASTSRSRSAACKALPPIRKPCSA